MPFDIQGARQSGYSDDEIADYLATSGDTKFDFAGARKAGYSAGEMLEFVGAQKPTERGGFFASAKQSIGAVIKGAGQLAGDLPGIDEDNAVKRYGQGIIEANPTDVQSLGDIADKPWAATKEAVGNAIGSIGGMAGARALGMGITAAAPLTGPLAPVTALAGQAVAWLGPMAIASLPSYGSIREKQILNDPQNNEDFKSKAVAALGAATVGAIETKFGPQNWALGAMTKEGREAIAKKFAETTLAKGIGFGAVKGAAEEGAEELVQSPIEQLASYDNPTTAESLKDTAFGGVMGAIGGGVGGGLFGGISNIAESTSVDEAIHAANNALDEGPKPPALPPATVASEDSLIGAINPYDVGGFVSRSRDGHETAVDSPQGGLFGGGADVAAPELSLSQAADMGAGVAPPELTDAIKRGATRDELFSQREAEISAREQQARDAGLDQLAESGRDLQVEHADALTQAQGFDNPEPTAIQLAMQQAIERRKLMTTPVSKRAIIASQTQNIGDGNGRSSNTRLAGEDQSRMDAGASSATAGTLPGNTVDNRFPSSVSQEGSGSTKQRIDQAANLTPNGIAGQVPAANAAIDQNPSGPRIQPADVPPIAAKVTPVAAPALTGIKAEVARIKAKKADFGPLGERDPKVISRLQEVDKTRVESAPDWTPAKNGFSSREYATEFGPRQEIRSPNGSVAARGLDTNGKPYFEMESGGTLDQFMSGAPFREFDAYFNDKPTEKIVGRKDSTQSAQPEAVVNRRKEVLASLDQMTGKQLRDMAKSDRRIYVKNAIADILEVRNQTSKQKRSEAARKVYARARGINTESDSMSAAIAKMGGINAESASGRLRLTPEELSARAGGIRRVFSKTGRTMDEMGAILSEMGYVKTDENGKHDQTDFEDKLAEAANGAEILTPQGMMKRAQEEYEAAQQEVEATSPEDYDAIERYADDMPEYTAEDVDELLASSASLADGLRSMGFSEQEIQDEISRQGAQGRAGQGDNGSSSRTAEESSVRNEAENFALEAESEQDARKRLADTEAQTRAKEIELKLLEEKDKQARIQKEIDARQQASADNFQLGQSAEDGLSGQGDLLESRKGERAAKPTSATGNNGDVGPDDLILLHSGLSPIEAIKHIGKKLDEATKPKIPEWLKQMPQETQDAARKAGIYVEKKPLTERLKALRDKAVIEAQQGLFDQFSPLKELGEKEYVLARLTKSADAPLEAVLLYGKPFLNDAGAIDVNTDKGGLIKSLQQLQGEHDRFFAWMAGNRAAKLKLQGRENLFTDTDISALKDLNSGNMPDGKKRALMYEKAKLEFGGYSKSVLDIAEKAGIINGADRAIWESDFYVPFYRVMDDQEFKGPKNVSGMANQYAFKKLKGGTDNLNDLMQNTLRNWSHLLSASLKNQAAQAALKSAEKMGVATNIGAKQKGSVFYLENGEQKHFAVEDAFILDAITSLEFAGFNNPAMKAMTTAKHYLTLGVTVSPTFKIRNLIRDQLAAVAVNPVSYNVMQNMIDGWKGTDKESQQYAKMLTGGGLMRFGTFLEDDRASHMKRLINSGVDKKTILDSPNKAKAALVTAWDWWQEVGDRSENITRASIYKQRYDQMIKDGKTADEAHLMASFAARDSMDFSLQGKWGSIRFLTQLVPFMNARLQGLYKIGRDGVMPSGRMLAPKIFGDATDSDKAKAMRFGAVTGAVALASVALMLAYRDDDDWKEREEWDKDAYWWFKIGGTAYRIPKPFEIGAIGTIAERGLDTMLNGFDKESRSIFLDRMVAMVSQTFSMNPVPQLFKPIIDLYANKDSFTGRPIETPGMENLSKSERIGANTSATAQAVGKVTSLVGVSPAQVDFLVNGYFSWLGTHSVMTVDFAMRPLMGLPEKPTRRWPDDYFVLGDFAKGLPSSQSKYMTNFYEQSKKVQEAMADIRYYQSMGNMEKALELRHENADEIRMAGMYSAASQRIGEINKRIKLTQARNIDPDLKREQIDRLSQQRNRLAKLTEERRISNQERPISRQTEN